MIFFSNTKTTRDAVIVVNVFVLFAGRSIDRLGFKSLLKLNYNVDYISDIYFTLVCIENRHALSRKLKNHFNEMSNVFFVLRRERKREQETETESKSKKICVVKMELFEGDKTSLINIRVS